MQPTLPDERVDRIRVEPLEPPDPPRALVRLHGAEGLDPVAMLLGWQDWRHLRYFAAALTAGEGGHFDDFGFAYDSDFAGEPWPEDERFTGVRVSSPFGDVVLSREAFERLMARFYAAIVETATRHDDPAVREPWWPEIAHAASALAARAR